MLPQVLPDPFRRHHRELTRILLAGLFLACIGKNLHVNRYDDFLIRGGSAIKRDAARFVSPLAINFDTDTARLQYYAGVPAVGLAHRNVVETPWVLDAVLDSWCYFHDVLYVSVTVSEDTPVPETWQIGDKTLTRLYSGFRSNRRNQQYAVYRYPVPEKAVRPSERTTESPVAPDSLVLNGGFETGAPPRWSREQRAMLEKRGLFSLLTSEILIPDGWQPNPAHGFNAGSGVEIGLSRDAIAGLRSLRMKSAGPVTLMTDQAFPCSKDYEVRLFYRGVSGSRFHIMVYLYNEKRQYCGYRMGPAFSLQGNAAAPFRTPLVFLPSERGMQFRLVLYLDCGEIFFDQFQLIPWKY